MNENKKQDVFTPKEVTRLQIDGSGVTKTIFTHISNLHSLLNKWILMQSKGTKLCKSINALKLHECYDTYYPHQLKSISESLLEIQDSFKNVVEAVGTLNKQLKALAELQCANEPVISTWSARQISDNVENIFQSLCQEFKLKKTVIENVMHCRDEKLIEVYTSAWEFDVYLEMDLCSYLFAEVGLSGIT